MIRLVFWFLNSVWQLCQMLYNEEKQTCFWKNKRDFPHFFWLSHNHYLKKVFCRYSDSRLHNDGRNCKISPFKFYITHKMADNINLYYFIQRLLERVLNKKVNLKIFTRAKLTHRKKISKCAFNGHQKSVHFLVRHFFPPENQNEQKNFFFFVGVRKNFAKGMRKK